MRRRKVVQKVELELQKLRKNLSFLRNRRGQNIIERRDTVGGDDQQLVTETVHVAHLALGAQLEARKFSFQD